MHVFQHAYDRDEEYYRSHQRPGHGAFGGIIVLEVLSATFARKLALVVWSIALFANYALLLSGCPCFSLNRHG